MWLKMSKTTSVHGLLLLLLSWAAVTSSLFGPPCMSQLGLRHGHSNPSLVFDTFVSSGDSAYIRLNGPKAWRVSEIKDTYIEINVSQPVLLTGLQVQGDPNLAGRVTAWTLETSLDCTDYRTEDYSVEYEHPLQVLTVHLKAIEFVSCLRLKPTRFEGKVAALRLELLGCVVSDSTSCPRDVHPIAEIWMEGGGRQLNFEHEVMLSWAKVLLDVNAYGDTGDIGLFYSRSCDHWTYIEPLDTNTMSITSSDSTSRWVTIEFDTPMRASCVRIFPPLATSLKEIHVDACSTSTLSRLQEMNIDTLTDIHEKSVNDAPSYETETPVFPQRMDTADVKAHMEKESKTKTVLEKSDVNTTEESPHEDDSIETTATANLTNNFTQPVTTKETPITTTLFSILSSQENYEDFAHGSESNDTIDSSKSVSVSENNSVVDNKISQASSHEEIQNASVGWVSMETVQQEANASAADNPSENSNNETSILFEEGPPGDAETNSHDVPEDGSVNTTVDLIMDNSTLSAAESENTTSSTDSGDHNVTEDATSDKNFENILPAVCGMKKAEEGIRKKRVISGQMNTPGQWPWLVSMHFLPELPFTKMSGFKHLCGANLIAPDWILTAAHCFSDDLFKGLGNASNWRIYFGMYDLAGEDDYQSFKQKRTIKTIINYPDYNIILKPLINDISLVRLNEPVEMTEFVSPICLDESDRYFKEEVCYVTGWGKTTTESPGSRFPYTAPVKIETLETCNKTYEALPEDNEIKMYVDIKPPVLCGGVGNGGEDACQGDSGGPLMCEHDGLWHLAAIVSAGLECGNQELPGLYTRVSQFDKWIKDTIETYESK